jgi:hypothetical protein
MARVNEALRDIFTCFTIEVNPTTAAGTLEGVVVTPLLPVPDRPEDLPAYVEGTADDGFVTDPRERITPPLRVIDVTCAKSADTQV